jgi:hypothetical protein
VDEGASALTETFISGERKFITSSIICEGRVVGTLSAGVNLYSGPQDVVSDLVYGEGKHVRLHLFDDADTQDPASELRRIPLLETVWKLRKSYDSWSHEPAQRTKGHHFGRFALPRTTRFDPHNEFPDSLSRGSFAKRDFGVFDDCQDRMQAS